MADPAPEPCFWQLCVPPRLPAATSVAVTALVAIGLGVFSSAASEGIWGDEVRKGSYCEMIRVDSSVRTPSNSWSNLAYIAVGGWALGRAAEALRGGSVMRAKYPSELPVTLQVLSALSSISLGFGSFFYHAALVRWAQTFDVAAMYWVANASIAATLWRWLRRIGPWIAPGRLLTLLPLIVAVLIADVIMCWKKWEMISFAVFAGQIGACIVSEAFHVALTWPPRKKLQAERLCSLRFSCRVALVGLLGVLIAGAGYVVRQTEVRQRKEVEDGEIAAFCNPLGFIQPHAVWHVFTAFGLLCLLEVQLGRQSNPVTLAPGTDDAMLPCTPCQDGLHPSLTAAMATTVVVLGEGAGTGKDAQQSCAPCQDDVQQAPKAPAVTAATATIVVVLGKGAGTDEDAKQSCAPCQDNVQQAPKAPAVTAATATTVVVLGKGAGTGENAKHSGAGGNSGDCDYSGGAGEGCRSSSKFSL